MDEIVRVSIRGTTTKNLLFAFLILMLGFAPAVGAQAQQAVPQRQNARDSHRGVSVTLLSYNVDNLFDATANGTEYPEFRPSSGRWTDRLYRVRLENTARVISDSVPHGPDIVVLQEIENQAVLKTLADEYLRRGGYRYSVMVPVPGSAINVGVLSRFPVTGVLAHEVRAETTHPLRNILEVTIDVHGVPLTLFACHWKAKSGGALRTEEARRIAAHIIITRMGRILQANPSAEALVVGDLNESEDEYERIGGQYRTAIINVDPHEPSTGVDPAHIPSDYAKDSIFVVDHAADLAPVVRALGGESAGHLVLFSPWGSVRNGSDSGSYWYRGSWETIDQFLLAPGLLDNHGLTLAGFDVVTRDYLVNRLGHPRKWQSRIGSGYSDHLPILLTLTVLKPQ
jgi:endonuclease/exonuclease/phosphatase family metal-dependent hydrolase